MLNSSSELLSLLLRSVNLVSSGHGVPLIFLPFPPKEQESENFLQDHLYKAVNINQYRSQQATYLVQVLHPETISPGTVNATDG